MATYIAMRRRLKRIRRRASPARRWLCATVAHSRYSHLLGINVAVIGIGGYVALLGAARASGDRGRLAGFLLAAIGFGFSAYLTYLELFVIDAVCQWCVASAVLMTLLLTVNATRAFGYAGTT